MNMAVGSVSDRVRLCECGVGPIDGKGLLRSGEATRFDSFQVEYSQGVQPAAGEEAIVVSSMADVIEKLPESILVKMDIEGSENGVLACRADWIGKVEYMMVEFHDRGEEKLWISVLTAEGWKSEKHFDTWHFRK
jgi:FkbM family methyltransferase